MKFLLLSASTVLVVANNVVWAILISYLTAGVDDENLVPYAVFIPFSFFINFWFLIIMIEFSKRLSRGEDVTDMSFVANACFLICDELFCCVQGGDKIHAEN